LKKNSGNLASGGMGLRVLIVDDSRVVRKIIINALCDYDVEFYEAGDGIEGLSSAIRHKPDIIFLDITMPQMSGIDLLERLKLDSRLKDIHVVMMTSDTSRSIVMRAVKLGVIDYIEKPFTKDELIERLEKTFQFEPKKHNHG
jgi:CheY-like chemotaxis protein